MARRSHQLCSHIPLLTSITQVIITSKLTDGVIQNEDELNDEETFIAMKELVVKAIPVALVYHGDIVYLSILPTAIFIRGLAEAFERNSSNIALRTLLRSYIDVQVGNSVVRFREHLIDFTLL
jgi:hypothetical protein